MHRKAHLVLLAAVMVVALFMVGCGEDDDVVGPSAKGTVIVSCTPDNRAIPWILTYPGGLNSVGVSDAVFDAVEVGEYTITWGEIEGLIQPSPDHSTQNLAVGETITFSGSYGEKGSIVIDVTPDNLDAPWLLEGPDDYSLNGTEDLTLTDMALGDYTLTWEAVAGYILPSTNPETATMDEGSFVTFSGTYVDDTGLGTIEIYQTPDGLKDTGWSLTGPQDETGSGYMKFNEMPVGQYSLTWLDVDGFIAPVSLPQALVTGGTVVFNGTYGKDQAYVQIPPASVSIPVTFTMGSTFDLESDETKHEVTLNGRFDMAATEVTNGQYVEALQWAYDEGHVTVTDASVLDVLDGSTAELLDLESDHCQINFSEGVFSASYPNRPVVEVSWYGAVAFCDWQSMQDGLDRAYDHSTWSCNSDNPYDAAGYRLPTEAEWEFACRAGTTTRFNTGNCLNAETEANFNGGVPWGFPLSGCGTGPYLVRSSDVGGYSTNDWGLLDIHGNVFEWCNDRYGIYGGDEDDPVGAGSGDSRVLRGGSWISIADSCRSAARYNYNPDYTDYAFGFRSVRSIP
ncbi:MAG: formylglycine-generating enzyme family protein [Gemmatimonadales bacterium]|nr:formylglycine-generating enzyme family protein [Gemmatimonadales bacterium]